MTNNMTAGPPSGGLDRAAPDCTASPEGPRVVCVLGGSFDPPTLAHTMVAANVLRLGYCDEVLFLPCGRRPDKPSLKTSVEDRFRMTELGASAAVDSQKEKTENQVALKMSVSDLELREPIALATYEAWERLVKARTSENDAGGKMDVEYVFLVGSDLPPTMKKWRHSEKLWAEVPFLVYEREGCPLGEHLPRNARVIEGENGERSLETSDTSSSEVRRLLETGDAESAKKLLASGVWEYIVQRRLYGVGRTAGEEDAR